MSDGGKSAVFLDSGTIACDLVKPSCVGDWEVHEHTEPREVAGRIAGRDIVFTNKVKIGADELGDDPAVKLIVVAATGYDIIDTQVCKRLGVAVANSPGYSASSVPEHAVALMFAVARSLVPLQREAHDGTWPSARTFCLHTHPIIELAGKRAGLIGSGSLGRATGALCEALGMDVRYLRRGGGGDGGLPRLGMDELLATSDVVSLHCPLDESNRHMIDAKAFGMMRPKAILVNTARGALVDPAALVDALESGRIAGAGIDVLETEPPPADHPLVTCAHPGLVLTPHVAWASAEVQLRLADLVAHTADSFFAGEPVNIVA